MIFQILVMIRCQTTCFPSAQGSLQTNDIDLIKSKQLRNLWNVTLALHIGGGNEPNIYE